VERTLSTNKKSSLGFQAFSNPNRGEETWLATPVLDLSRTNKASVFFDVSYATQSNGNERLRVLASTDCGQTYPFCLYDQAGESIFLPLNLQAIGFRQFLMIGFVSLST
jgi:hypothetical protein